MGDRVMNDRLFLRPADAAARFGVSAKTLSRWAQAGLIGRSKRGRMTWYLAQDVADEIARHFIVLPGVPATSREVASQTDDEAYIEQFWAGAAR